MKATGIVRRVEECVIIGQTEKVGYTPEFSLILSNIQFLKVPFDFFCSSETREVHTIV